MSKDPAILWYVNDWVGATMTFTRPHKGAYMDLLMAQHNNGHMSLQDIQVVLGSDFEIMWESKLRSKFVQDANGLYFNKKLEETIQKRRAFSESRKNNLQSKSIHMDNHMDSDMEAHMENENINEIINKNMGGLGGIKNYHQLMNYAKKVYAPFEVNFDKEKNVFRYPPCNEQTTNEKVKWHEEWKPKIKALNDKLIEINL